MCTHYRIGDRVLPDGYMPASLEQYKDVDPVYLELPGWTEDISQVRNKRSDNTWAAQERTFKCL
jgi:adenylosuccinate synthase